MIELYTGNCRTFLSNYDGPAFDAVITDPPYASGTEAERAQWAQWRGEASGTARSACATMRAPRNGYAVRAVCSDGAEVHEHQAQLSVSGFCRRPDGRPELAAHDGGRLR